MKQDREMPPLPLVSILIPCYNAARWIQQCIESALDQSYPNKEIIVIDDGSTDASAELIAEFGTNIIFHRVPHAGGNAARNRLTQFARGEWLQYLDADDYLLSGKIDSQMALAAGHCGAVDVVYSPVIVNDDQQSRPYCVLQIRDKDETLTFIDWAPLNTGGLLLRRQAVLRAGAWKEDQPCCQEHELLLRLMLAGCRFALHNRAEAVYRKHSPDTVSRRDPLQVIRLRMELTGRLVEHLQSNGRFTPAHRKAFYRAQLECARSAWPLDAGLAEQLSAKARNGSGGVGWVHSSAALPFRYQVALRAVGFARAERLAEWVRRDRR